MCYQGCPYEYPGSGECTLVRLPFPPNAWCMDGQDSQDGQDGQDGREGQDGQDGEDGQDSQDSQDGQAQGDGQDSREGIIPWDWTATGFGGTGDFGGHELISVYPPQPRARIGK